MVAVAVYAYSSFPVPNTTPYLTPEQVARAPLSRGVEKFFHAGSDADDTAAIVALIRRVSRLADDICDQPLASCVDVETRRVPVVYGDMVMVRPRYCPIREVRSVQVGSHVTDLTDLDLSTAEIEPSQLRIQLPYLMRYSLAVLARWTYVAGFPVTALAADAAAGDTTITVADSTGIVPGHTEMTIPDGTGTEYVVASAVTGNVLTVPPLARDHDLGTPVTAIPEAVQEACLLLLDAGLEFADTYALTLTRDDRGNIRTDDIRASKVRDAVGMLTPYMRRQWTKPAYIAPPGR